jgi:hypothetical protein
MHVAFEPFECDCGDGGTEVLSPVILNCLNRLLELMASMWGSIVLENQQCLSKK